MVVDNVLDRIIACALALVFPLITDNSNCGVEGLISENADFQFYELR